MQARVYPRACGGTLPFLLHPAPVMGLSPRVRGNLTVFGTPHVHFGSIPARAGELDGVWYASCALRVYPRACGGT